MQAGERAGELTGRHRQPIVSRSVLPPSRGRRAAAGPRERAAEPLGGRKVAVLDGDPAVADPGQVVDHRLVDTARCSHVIVGGIASLLPLGQLEVQRQFRRRGGRRLPRRQGTFSVRGDDSSASALERARLPICLSGTADVTSEERPSAGHKTSLLAGKTWKWRGPESNRGHHDFQAIASGALRRQKPHNNAVDAGAGAWGVPADAGRCA
jgi:hypothetical protein